MKLKTEYRIIPSLAAEWDLSSSGNNRMRLMIEEHGGSFFPTKMLDEDSSFITEVTFKDGTTADAEGFGNEYFEIADYEFKYFEPVHENGGVQSGPTRLDLTVTPENAEEMIELIKKVFKK
ncbi:hypothetical protein CPT_Metamorpho_035 [Klebsiella phage Metamorpho]|nr:hypothetical protein CPT_Metamorpho_035 [Klebsiella phage Metamorpho]